MQQNPLKRKIGLEEPPKPHKEENMVFDVSKWKRKKKQQKISCPAEGAPKQLGVWTKTSDTKGGEYLYGDPSGLPKYQICSLPQDLNDGYPEKYIEKKQLGCFIGHVLQVLRRSCSQDQLKQFHVITFRNNLNKIGLTLHQSKDSWTIDACMLDDVLVLEIVHEDDGLTYPNAHKFMYYGYKFEALCTGENVVDSTSEFGSCVELTIGGLKLAIGAEIDCFEPPGQVQSVDDYNPQLSDYIELKSYRLPQSREQYRRSVRNKHPRWWLQSWIAGVPRLALGGRDDNGILREIHVVPVMELLQISERMGVGFNPWEIITFLTEVLSWMRKCAKELMCESQTQKMCHFRFQYNPEISQICCKIVDHSDLKQRMQEVWSVKQDTQKKEEEDN